MSSHVPSLRRSIPGALEVLVAVIVAMLLPVPGQGATVTVRPGDTISGIAARHGVTVPALASANGIRDPHRVVAGTRLRVPGTASGAVPATAGGTHTVRPGETLAAIARRHGVSTGSLASANGIRNPNLIVAGTRLRVPGSGATPATGGAAVASSGGHAVRPGETLSAIAARYGVTPAALASANGIADHDVIVAGRVLRVPTAAGTTGGAGPAYVGPPTVPRAQVAAMITAAANRYGVDPALARAIAYQESGFNQNVRSSAGAIGAMQLMPYTAAWVGPSLVGRTLDPYRVQDNVDGGAAYLAWLMRRTGDPRRAAAGYYQGLNALLARGMYDETKVYVASVMALYGRV